MVPFSGTIVRAHKLAALAVAAYVAFLITLSYPPIQRSLVYLHHVRYPMAGLDEPDTLGFAPGKVRNFYLETPDGETLGAWHVLPNSVYDVEAKKGIPAEGDFPDSVFDAALKDYPSVVYFHGNAGTRGNSHRIRVARMISDEQHNFVLIDYRGFADSTGKPSEEGLLIDARTVWDYLTLKKSVPPSRITVMGQSLGTGVSAGLVGRLADEGIIPKGLVLVAPFSSIGTLLETYKLFNLVPVLKPLKIAPWLMSQFHRFLWTKFDTKSVIQNITCPLLLLHAIDDPVIPHSHSSSLAHHLLDPLLPRADDAEMLSPRDARELARASIVNETRVGRWGVVTRFERGEGYGSVTWAEARRGQHNDIGTSEMSLKLIAELLHSR